VNKKQLRRVILRLHRQILAVTESQKNAWNSATASICT